MLGDVAAKLPERPDGQHKKPHERDAEDQKENEENS